jgi:hypothetical protein
MGDEKKKVDRQGQQPEALAQFGKSARHANPATAGARLKADEETSPIPTDNAEKHSVAEKLLNRAAHGEEPDPETAGVHDLPDRIIDKQLDHK